MSKAKASNADFLLLVCRLNDAVILRREMVKQRWSPMGVISPGSPGMYEEQFIKTLGKYAEYCISNTVWFNTKSKMTKQVAAAFKKQFPKDSLDFHGTNVGYTFEAIMIAADAFKRAKSTDPEGARRRDPLDRHPTEPAHVAGRADQVQRQGPGRGQPLAVIQVLKGKPDGRDAGRDRGSEAGLPRRPTTGRCSLAACRSRCSRTSPVAITGVLTGLVYGLMALGLSVIFGVVRIVNFAHGEIMTLAMYAAVLLFAALSLDPFLVMLPIAPRFFVLGYALQATLINPLHHRPEHAQFMLLVGLAFMLVERPAARLRPRCAQRA